MKTIKRIAALALCLALVCSLLPGLSLRANAETYSGICGAEGDGSNLTWSFDTETGLLTIEGSGKMSDYNFYEAPWFKYGPSMTAVSLPDGLTSIGICAFCESISLTSITIPDSVTSIGSYAFYNCSVLENVTMGSSLESIGNWAFCHCYKLKNLSFGTALTSIGTEAFQSCADLEAVSFQEGLKVIDDSAFSVAKVWRSFPSRQAWNGSAMAAFRAAPA